MNYVNDGVRAWDALKTTYPMVEIYQRAWKGDLLLNEARVFWTFGAGIEFKVWCARRFLSELKGILEGFKGTVFNNTGGRNL